MKKKRILADLQAVLDAFPLSSLQHLQANMDRLVSGAYRRGTNGCLLYLLSEKLPPSRRIDSKESLVRHFGGDPAAPQYQPPKWIVRLWDRQICNSVIDRYGPAPRLTSKMVKQVLEKVIAERLAKQAA